MHRFQLALFIAFGLLNACNALEASSKTENQPADDLRSEQQSTVNETLITAGALSGLHIDAGTDSPIILIIPGSGPTDLNGNNPLGVEAQTYRLLARALKTNEISTVRVDKRGMFSSEGAGNPNDVTVDIYAEDYSLWIDTITQKTGANCIYVLGHSEGALMASAAANLNKKVCGQILVSGVGRSFGEVLREQLRANPANFIIMKEAESIIGKFEAGETVPTENMHKAFRPLFGEHIQGFMISIMQTNPADLAAGANVKTLIVQGETDLQTSVEDAEALASATGGTLVIVPGVNHVLKAAPLNRRKNLKTYRDPNLPISQDVIDVITDFVSK